MPPAIDNAKALRLMSSGLRRRLTPLEWAQLDRWSGRDERREYRPMRKAAKLLGAEIDREMVDGLLEAIA